MGAAGNLLVGEILGNARPAGFFIFQPAQQDHEGLVVGNRALKGVDVSGRPVHAVGIIHQRNVEVSALRILDKRNAGPAHDVLRFEILEQVRIMLVRELSHPFFTDGLLDLFLVEQGI